MPAGSPAWTRAEELVGRCRALADRLTALRDMPDLGRLSVLTFDFDPKADDALLERIALEAEETALHLEEILASASDEPFR